MDGEAAQKLATTLSEGRWTHDYPITEEIARDIGLPVSTDLPNEVREIISLYPQPRNRRPSVEYIPLPYGRPGNKSERQPGDRSSVG